jgi:hypothetical protein
LGGGEERRRSRWARALYGSYLATAKTTFVESGIRSGLVRHVSCVEQGTQTGICMARVRRTASM